MDAVNKIPVTIGHAGKRFITKNTGIVDKHIDTSKCLECSLNHLFTFLDRIIVGNGFTTCFKDFFNNEIGGTGIGTLSIGSDTKIVDDNGGT
jgi:hypothetical protein